MRFKRCFTLIELCVALSLLVLVGSFFGWQMTGMISRKRFSSQAERLQDRLKLCRSLSILMQADWKGVWENGAFSVYCVEDPQRSTTPSVVCDSLELVFNGEKREKMCFEFASGGAISPCGLLEIYSKKGDVIRLTLPEFFAIYEKL